jgi:DNA-binding response OmpR family regulator
MTKVLVIEDDEDLRLAICKRLKQAGYDALEAGDGRAGLELATREHPELVITDIIMPDRDGIEAIVELRGLAPSPAIIAMSGMTGARGYTPLDDASLLGADAVLKKPFEIDDLLAMAERLLR